ncbi:MULTISPECIES: DNA repair protein RecO [unclassified Staphylococcus]|uniref:DNA repair protein RecO n=1 Tax=unclassified Staphylococcus TaxID=91994 RepID=UPI0021D05309|nr:MULTISPECIES: DNA repair protein RecO [unclassified Staphylococcus]UXR77328.1 DNA repair protein RecO [Staphylococcus sp. IVB6227]UXR81591.1 DNA repair protein RecO [Staphylococcus sp. IVB6214]
MLIKQKGIIIKTVDYGESDKIITVLNEFGAKVPLMVRRAKKVKSGLQATTQLFVKGLFIYNKWRGMGTLSSVDVINSYYGLRVDIFTNSYASLCLEAIDGAMDTEHVDAQMYALLEFALTQIDEGLSAQLIANIVLLKCMTYYGFDINLTHCAVKNSDRPGEFVGYSFKYDGVLSKSAAHFDPHYMPLTNKAIYLMAILKQLPLSKINSISIHDEIVEEMSQFILMIYKEYSGVYFKSQRLINQLRRFNSTIE